MELSGIPMENFPPIVGNDSKAMRKLSLLEARMVGAGTESREGSLPPNDGSRGSENNSNSMSTIGFAKPRAYVGSPGDGGAQQSNSRGIGGGGGSRPRTEPNREDGAAGKRKSTAEGEFSPPRPSAHSPNPGTPSTLSTSPGESRDWSSARLSAHGAGDDASGTKRARTGGPRQPPPPPRLSLPQGNGDRQTSEAPGGGVVAGTAKGTHGHARRGSRGKDSVGSPPKGHESGKTGTGHSCDRVAHGRDQSQAPKQSQHSKTSDAHARSGASLPPPPPPAFNAASGADLSPSSGGKNGKGGGHAGLGAATKTIQSYFCKPANGSAVQNLAASYGAGDPAGPPNAPSVLPREVDLSGGDGQSQYCDAGYHVQPMAKVGRSSSSGRLGVGGGDSGRSLQHRVLAAEDQDVDQAQHGQGHAHGRVGHVGAMGGNGGKEGAQVRDAQEDIERLTAKLQEAEALATKLQKELDRANLERGSMESMADTLQKQLDRKIEEFKAKEADRDTQKTQLTSVVENLLRKVSTQEASDCRAKLARDMLELGKIVSVKTGHIGKYVEAFEEGSAFKEVEKKTADLFARKTKLEARKRAAAKLLRSTAPVASDEDPGGQARLEAIEEEESVRMHLMGLKREEVALQEEKRALDARKVLHIRELKRVAHEDRSKFAKRPTLAERYVLLNLLGKGGFSEVWRAFDLVHAEDVAVKVHQLLNNWNEPQKANFIRHVTREYEIHQQMRHPRIVNLTDVFEICCDSFATVLDYCRGTDLECLLRERKQFPERDARALVLQVARGLQYLNTAQGEGANRRGAIIHYDLKPGNILLDENGDVKITDFGLSKILEIKKDTERGLAGGTSMELTSKGAGTYWYLPPECFGDSPRISSKVDVWSLGVVFYQMLYGVRPFGEGLSQEKILREKVIVNANRVEFPSKPVVSEEAKTFIRSCLTYTHSTRPDVRAMCNLPYLATPAAKRGT